MNEKPRVAAVQPFATAFVEVQVTIVVVCPCKGIVLVLRSLFQPTLCPNCRTEFLVDRVTYDVTGKTKEALKEGAALGSNLGQAGVDLNVAHRRPLIAMPAAGHA